ncbi:MAG: cysteine peptidase family C39 domain-containing protein [Spirochaetota bacterium]
MKPILLSFARRFLQKISPHVYFLCGPLLASMLAAQMPHNIEPEFLPVVGETAKENLRFRGVLEQHYDSSCALATAATLLQLYWHVAITEKELLNQAFPKLKERELDEESRMNMLKLQNLIEAQGFQTKGFKMDLQQLHRAVKQFGPVVLHYEKPTTHFALLLGVVDGYFVVADSARGIETLSARQLSKRRSPLVLLVTSQQYQLQQAYRDEILQRAKARIIRLERMHEW